MFEHALLLRNRESFVDMFLERGFRLHARFLTARRFAALFHRAEDRDDFFAPLVLEALLLRSPGASLSIDQAGIDELNCLVHYLVGIERFIRLPDSCTPSSGPAAAPASTVSSPNHSSSVLVSEPAERRALLALLVFAVLMNRCELAVVLWKYCAHPVPTALFVSSLFSKLGKACADADVAILLRESGRRFSDIAFGVVDLAYRDVSGGGASPASDVLEQEYADFDWKTPLQLAYDSNNRRFLAHECCQKWLSRLFKGGIQVVSGVGSRASGGRLAAGLGAGSRLVPESMKILLSAWLVLPMFFWIRFPPPPDVGGEVDDDDAEEPIAGGGDRTGDASAEANDMDSLTGSRLSDGETCGRCA